MKLNFIKGGENMAQYTEYHPLKFWLDPASIAEIVAHIQTYLVNNPINSTTEIETIIHDYLIAHPELIGGVDSVNGQTGEVVLTADNISGGENVTIKDVLDSLQDQIDDIVASIPSDYQQLIDDVSDLKSATDEHSSIISANLMGIDAQQNLYPGAADWSGTWLNSDAANLKLSEERYNGYPVYYSSQGWRKIRKEIPIEAGKTYTVAAWIKPTAQANCFLYIKDQDTTNPATTSTSMLQQNNVPANTWIHMVRTFTCSVSGNISPYAYASQPFYIAKYELVEGDSIFSLADTLNSKVGSDAISGVGDYLRYDFSLGTSSGKWWNPIINKAYSAGTKCRLIFGSYTGQYLNYVRVDGRKSDGTYTVGLCQIDNPVRGGSAEFATTEMYTGFRVQHYRTTDESNVSSVIYFATDKELGLTYDNLHTFSQRIYHVEKDGSGDFTSLIEAISTACQSMDSIVYIGAGTWDIVSELGDDYLNTVSSSNRGLYLKNRVHIICSSEALITCNYTGTREDTITWLSAFNSGEYGFTLENARIESSKCRYSIHDERGTSEDQYINKYINCNIKHDNTNGRYGQCIGGGLGKDGHIVISGCVFENPNMSNADIVSYHNTWYAGGTGKSTVEVVGNYFKGSTTFRASWFGASQEISEFLVHDNSIGYPVIHRVENQSMMDDNPSWIKNTELLEWNNVVRT